LLSSRKSNILLPPCLFPQEHSLLGSLLGQSDVELEEAIAINLSINIRIHLVLPQFRSKVDPGFMSGSSLFGLNTGDRKV
jgi:hypothetical protein